MTAAPSYLLRFFGKVRSGLEVGAPGGPPRIEFSLMRGEQHFRKWLIAAGAQFANISFASGSMLCWRSRSSLRHISAISP